MENFPRMPPSSFNSPSFQGAASDLPYRNDKGSEMHSNNPPNTHPINQLQPPCPMCEENMTTGLLECYNCAGHGDIIKVCRECWGSGIGPTTSEPGNGEKVANSENDSNSFPKTDTWSCPHCSGKGDWKRACLVCDATGKLISYCGKCEGGRAEGEKYLRTRMQRDAGVFEYEG
jgi:hypothetical protein